jgi:hypothetical protein
LKQVEAVLRKLTHYKYQLSLNLNTVDGELRKMLGKAGVTVEKTVSDAVAAYYREKNRTVVSVDVSALDKIRLEALDTQEKLIVPDSVVLTAEVPDQSELVSAAPQPENPGLSAVSELPEGWTGLKKALNDAEREAIAVILAGGNAARFAHENGIMPEVLADSINEKAVDYIGDNILASDDGMLIYDEYKDMLIKMLDVG